MAESLPEFLSRFVLPLHAGGPLVVGSPFGVADRDRMAAEADALFDAELGRLRLQRAAEFMPTLPLDDPDLSDLSLWMGLHNILALDHPDRARVWARVTTWSIVLKATRALIHYAAPADLAEQLSRHVSVQCFYNLVRVDQVARTPEQSVRFSGQAAPRSVRRMASIGEIDLSEERVVWVDAQHAAAADMLLPELMFVSPLTELLSPPRRRRMFDPRSPARWLRSRAGARAVVHAWAGHEDWVATGASVVGNLLRALGHEALLDDKGDEPAQHDAPQGEDMDENADFDAALWRTQHAEPASVGELTEGETTLALGTTRDYGVAEHAALLGGLIHLHFLKVLAFEARVSLGGRKDRHAARAFLALPLMLPQLIDVLGDPLVGVQDPDALRRWDDYLAHLRGLVPLDVLENLVAALVTPIVQEYAA